MVAVWIVLGVAAVVGLVLLASYNRFVRQRQLIDNAWANVDTELRRRYDLIPNVVETVKGYAAHERATFEEVIQARAAAVADEGDPAHQADTENVLVGALRHLMALQEAYPDLKASTGFLQLQNELVHTEDRIQAARRFYNNNVRDYNTRVQAVPSNVVARLFGFRLADYFEVEPVARQVPTVDLG